MARKQTRVLEQLGRFLLTTNVLDDVAALEAEAAALLALSQVARFGRGSWLQRQGLRFAAMALRRRIVRRNARDARLHSALDHFTYIGQEMPLEGRVRRAIGLLVQNSNVLQILWARWAQLTRWCVRAQTQVRAEENLEELAQDVELDEQ